MRASPPTRHPCGLTLLEMMVALVIVALLASLALPSFGGMLARHRLKSAAAELVLDLAELRFQATRRGTPLHLQVTPGDEWCYALSTASGCDCQRAQTCQLKTVGAHEYPGVRLVRGQDLRIDPKAWVAVGDAAVLQAPDGAQLHVGLSPLGRPRVCAPGAAVPGYPLC